MVYIQYASDLHIDHFPKGTRFESFLIPVSPILVLAGDICSVWDPLYRHFLAWCSRNWYLVILVTGNHEYFCMNKSSPKTISQTDTEVYTLCNNFPNVRFLQNGASYTIPGTSIRFVGATLWSAVEPSIWSEVEQQKGDYVNTYTHVHSRTKPSDIYTLHRQHVQSLRNAISSNEMLIVVTHHMPSEHLLEDSYKNDVWKSCYASKNDDLLTTNVRIWICGHSHRAKTWKSPGPLCVMNARGYNCEEELQRKEERYNPRACIQIGKN